MAFKFADVVVLAQDVPAAGLHAGAEGVVIDKFLRPELAYEVEFFNDDSGVPCATIALLPEQLLPEAAFISNYSEEQSALDNSVRMKNTSMRRAGVNYDTEEFMVFDLTRGNTYHGHVRSWAQLHPSMRYALELAGLADYRGDIILKSHESQYLKQFEQTHPISKADAATAFESDDPALICSALVSVAFHESDWRWAQDRCLEFLEGGNPEIGGLAATCLGHIARIHKMLDKKRVVAALRMHLANPDIAGRVEDALEDIELLS